MVNPPPVRPPSQDGVAEVLLKPIRRGRIVVPKRWNDYWAYVTIVTSGSVQSVLAGVEGGI